MSKPERKLVTRKRLLEAAIEAVAHHGYADATVAQVIATAEASRSTFYEHFKDNDQCILMAAAEICEQLMSSVNARTAVVNSQDVPTAVLEGLFEFALADGAKARVLFTEMLAGGPRAMDLRDAVIDQLAEVTEKAWKVDEQEPTLDMPAQALIGGIFRLFSFRIRRGGSGLHELQSQALAWMHTYTLEAGTPWWQSTAALERMRTPARARVAPVLAPSPFPKGRHSIASSEIAKKHRERLLHATAACVYKRDYATVAVADIVSEAQVSRGVFYKHFHDKQSAVMGAMQHTFVQSMTAAAAAFFAEPVSASSWPSQLWAAARALSEYYADAPEFVYLAFVEGYAVGPASMQLVEERMMAFRLLLESGYRCRPQAESLPPEISEIIAVATFELAYREVRQRKPKQFSQLLPQLAYMNLAPFMGASDATEFVREQIDALGAEAHG